MSDFQINDYLLQQECEGLAKDIFDEIGMADDETFAERLEEARDMAHEWADGHQWVIYHHKALMICAHCDVQQGEQFLEDIGMPENVTFNQLASIIAYGEMRARIEAALQEIADSEEEEEESAD